MTDSCSKDMMYSTHADAVKNLNECKEKLEVLEGKILYKDLAIKAMRVLCDNKEDYSSSYINTKHDCSIDADYFYNEETGYHSHAPGEAHSAFTFCEDLTSKLEVEFATKSLDFRQTKTECIIEESARYCIDKSKEGCVVYNPASYGESAKVSEIVLGICEEQNILEESCCDSLLSGGFGFCM
jgi:hypothetical protein